MGSLVGKRWLLRRPAFGVVLALALMSSGAVASEGGCRVFLAPGAFAPGSGGAASWFISNREYFAEYRVFFEKKGCEVRMGELPPDGTIEERALVFRDQLEKFVQESGGKLWVVAHSQAALDLRFALKTLKVSGVEALVSIGAPHGGTPLADWVVKQRDQGSWLYWLLRLAASYDLRELRFAGELSRAFLHQHRTHFEAVPGVRYGAARGVCVRNCTRSIQVLQWLADLPPGDGLVPADAQGFGEALGTYDLDHLSEIGVDSDKRPERARLLERFWTFFSKTTPL